MGLTPSIQTAISSDTFRDMWTSLLAAALWAKALLDWEYLIGLGAFSVCSYFAYCFFEDIRNRLSQAEEDIRVNSQRVSDIELKQASEGDSDGDD